MTTEDLVQLIKDQPENYVDLQSGLGFTHLVSHLALDSNMSVEVIREEIKHTLLREGVPLTEMLYAMAYALNEILRTEEISLCDISNHLDEDAR